MRQARRDLGVLEENGRLGIGVGNRPTTRLLRDGNDLFGSRLVTRDQILFTGHPGYFSVLTPPAAEIAAGRSNGIGAGTWIEMKQWFFFDRVHMLADRASVCQRIKCPFPILAHLADPLAAVADQASVSAQMAPTFPFSTFSYSIASLIGHISFSATGRFRSRQNLSPVYSTYKPCCGAKNPVARRSSSNSS